MSKTGELAIADMEKAEVLNFFASVLYHTAQFTESRGRDWENDEPATDGEDQV